MFHFTFYLTAINSSLPNSKNETLTQSQSLSHSASPGVDSDFISEDEDLILSDFNETLLDEIEKFSAAYDDPLLSALAQDQNENEVDSLFDDLEKILNSDEEGLGPQVSLLYFYLFYFVLFFNFYKFLNKSKKCFSFL